MNIKVWENKGFSLLEIMIAISIFAISVLVILDLQGSTMIQSGRSEYITTATMLARLKMAEVRLDLEKQMSKGEFPAENKTMDGEFDEPFEEYKWEVKIKKVELPVPESAGGGEEGQQNMDMMMTAFKMVAEKIGESTREVQVIVTWNEGKDEQSLELATHIVKL